MQQKISNLYLKIKTYITTNFSKDKLKSHLRLVLSVFVIFFAVFVIVVMFSDSDIENFSYDEEEQYDETCNVQGILLRGDLYTYGTETPEGSTDMSASEDTLYLISDSETRDNIKAYLIEVDSYGGSPAAAEEIYEAIKYAQKPVVAHIREAGLSAAYYAIADADKIYSLRNSSVGSIGVTQSYLDYTESNSNEGLKFVELAAGKFKDSGTPDRALTQEERNLFMRDLTIVHENFIRAVAEGRNLAVEEVQKLADGSMMLGQQAIESGLVDEIGGYNEAVTFIEDEYLDDVAKVCW